VDLALKAADENGKPASAYFFAAVVDEQALMASQHSEQGPLAFFFLASEFPGGEELDDAEFLISDTPAAHAALDQFLGTHGWRRFAEHDTAPLLARAVEPANAAAAVDRPEVFCRDNSDDLRLKYDAALARACEELRHNADQERQDLQEQKEEHGRAVAAATAALHDYEDLPRNYGRIAAGVVVLLLLAAGGVFLLVGFVRAMCGCRPTVAFASAFTSLLLCLLIYAVNGYVNQPGAEPDEPGRRARVANSELAQLPHPAQAPWDKERRLSGSPPPLVGRFTAVARDAVGAALAPEGRTTSSDVKLAERFMGPGTGGDLGTFKEATGRKKESPEELAKRFTRAPQKANQTYGGGVPPGPAPAMAPAAPSSTPHGTPGAAAKMKSVAKAATAEAKGAKDAGPTVLLLREYSYRQDRAAGNLQDTVLWCPAVFAPDGTAQVGFDLLSHFTTYRVLLYAHSPSGRLGAYQGKIETRK
jgi:hypothetical protein